MPAPAASQAAAADPAAFSQTSPQSLALTGRWTALDMGDIERRLDTLQPPLVVELTRIGGDDAAALSQR